MPVIWGKSRMVALRVLLFSCLVQLAPAAGKCPPLIDCGYLGNIEFPFTSTQHPDCGIWVIHGCDDYEPQAKKSIKNKEEWFDIAKIEGFTITIRDDKLHDILLQESCEILRHNSTFTVNTPLASSRVQHYVSLYGCNDSNTLDLQLQHYYSVSNTTAICKNNNGTSDIKPETETVVVVSDPNPSNSSLLKGCTMVQLPTSFQVNHLDPVDLFTFITADIAIQIQVSPDCSTCHDIHGGQCRLDNRGKFYCDQGKSIKTRLMVAAAAPAIGVMIFLAWYLRRSFFNNKNPTHQTIEMFLKNHGHLAAKRYTYMEIKKATNSFKNKLGQGGYGSVYKGKLHDGSLVAVKVLSESKGNGEEFINEVASISVTSHVNIVSLLGFYLEGSKRALIYDYMPNGSLEKFIYEDKDPLKLKLHG